jgi:hypothetical protein
MPSTRGLITNYSKQKHYHVVPTQREPPVPGTEFNGSNAGIPEPGSYQMGFIILVDSVFLPRKDVGVLQFPSLGGPLAQPTRSTDHVVGLVVSLFARPTWAAGGPFA